MKMKLAAVSRDRRSWIVECPLQDAGLGDRVRSSHICKDLGVQLLILCTDRSQVRWFGHLETLGEGLENARGFTCPI